MNEPEPALLAALPAVERALREDAAQAAITSHGRVAVVGAVRQALAHLRGEIRGQARLAAPSAAEVASLAVSLLPPATSLQAVVNASGVIIHTNLSRSVLCRRAAELLANTAGSYTNLEMDLQTGKRGSRQVHVQRLLTELTGAEAAAIYNNNAAALLLVLGALAAGKEVIVSRGQLVEIGGAFRLPDVMTQSGCKLVEVGCTNRTHLRDYANAITENTGAILRVHHSNYRIIGFVTEPSIEALAGLARDRGVPLIDDLGSGALIDLSAFGLPREPLVADSVAAGADAVCFSGDKLLGGPQAGVVVGKRDALARITTHPLARALRVDKLTVAAMLGTLQSWRDPELALREVPTLRMASEPVETVRCRARRLLARLQTVLAEIGSGGWRAELVEDDSARMGGGALPEAPIATAAVHVSGPDDQSAEALARRLRTGSPAVVPRLHEHAVVLDLRTVSEDELEPLGDAVCAALVG